jgi:hypothetical protein
MNNAVVAKGSTIAPKRLNTSLSVALNGKAAKAAKIINPMAMPRAPSTWPIRPGLSASKASACATMEPAGALAPNEENFTVGDSCPRRPRNQRRIVLAARRVRRMPG